MSSTLDQTFTDETNLAGDRTSVNRRSRVRARLQWYFLPSPARWRVFLAAMTLVSFGSFLYRSSWSYDLFIDEPFYAAVGQSIARGQLPYAAGVHFFLHPPGYFLAESLWMQLFGLHNEVFAQVYSLRKLIAVFAALSVLMIALIVDKVVGRRAAVFAALVFAVNAFVHRDNGINILEPSTVFWALAGYAVLVNLAASGTRKRSLQVVAGGLLFGLSILSKEFAIFITIVPLAFVFLFGAWLSRREALATAALATAPYLGWLAVVIGSGNWGTYVSQVSTGFRRTAGTTQLTGFNSANAPSFVETLLKNVYYLWTAYAILGLGTLAILYLAWRPRSPQQRFIACYGLGAIPLLAYCVSLGANEEQFFNFLLTPALISLIAVGWALWPRLKLVLRALLVALVAVALISDVGNWIHFRTSTDNGTYRVDRWMAQHVPIGSVVAVTNSVQREIFTRYRMVNDSGGDIASNPDVQYLVVFYRQVDEGYAFIGRSAADEQTAGLPVLFETSDRSNGRLVVYGIR